MAKRRKAKSAARTQVPAPVPEKVKSQARFGPRTRIVLIALLIPLGYLSYRSFVAYRLRSIAWEAKDLRDAGSWRKLEKVASEWARRDPDSALPWLIAAEAAEMLGAKARMVDYLEKMPTDDPRSPDLLLESATIYFGDLNRPQAAVDACYRSLALKPANPEAHRRLVFYYGITSQRTKMLRQAREAMKLGADSRETYVYLMGANWLSFSNAYELNSKWLRSGENTETYAVAAALHARGAGFVTPQLVDVDEVDADRLKRIEHIKMLKKYLKQYPSNPELLCYLMEESAVRGDTDEVARLLSQVPASAGDDNRIWYYKGWLNAARDQLDEAEASFRKALELHPYAWRSQLALAEVLRRLQKFEEVETLNQLSLMGKELRETILQLPDVQSVPVDVFQKMQQYAAGCGDELTATRMAERLKQLTASGA